MQVFNSFQQVYDANATPAGAASGMSVFQNSFPPIDPLFPTARTDIQKRQQEEQKRKQNQPDDNSVFADSIKRIQPQADQDAYIADFDRIVTDRERGANTKLDAEIKQKIAESDPFWEKLGNNLSDTQRINHDKCLALFDRILKIYGKR